MLSATQWAPSPPANLRGRTVLVIEDHADSRELLTQVLRNLQAHVVAVPNIEQAERELQFARPHLIICDMKLPDGTGAAFLQWLRGQRRGGNLPCIAITGWDQIFAANAAEGFDAYMRKPLDIDTFCTLAVALAHR